MGLLVLAYLGGVLTIVSPCILPVLPFVFARADKPFVRSGLPLLVGMALTFALVATLATAGGWVVQANLAGRILAMVLLGLFGLMLLFPALSDRVTRPLVALGSRLSNQANETDGSIGASLLLGVATGLLWAPCAGPILGLILTGAAINGASASTALLLAAYAAGAATSLAAALLVGGRLFAAMKRSLGAGEWIRRGLGVLVLAGVAAIAMGADTGILTQLSQNSTTQWEQMLLEKTGLVHKTQSVAVKGSTLPVEGQLPPLDGATLWINSAPLTREQLRGKVVLVDFWTYSCINCLRSLPYINAWAAKYKDHGLVVLGVHTPEFAFEKDQANVRKAVKDLGIAYPVPMDNDYAIWQAFNNQYWPAHYFIDAEGRIRAHQFGEGDYAHSEQIIQQLLTEAGYSNVPGGIVNPSLRGAEAAADLNNMQSPETYIGYDKSQNFMSMPFTDEPHRYVAKGPFGPDQWNLNGLWTLHNEKATLDEPGGGIVFHFHARDLHLVMSNPGKPIKFRVTLDGKAPGASHGTDIDADGNGTVDGQRLYQLIRQNGGATGDHMFEIKFDEPGVDAFAFTFG